MGWLFNKSSVYLLLLLAVRSSVNNLWLKDCFSWNNAMKWITFWFALFHYVPAAAYHQRTCLKQHMDKGEETTGLDLQPLPTRSNFALWCHLHYQRRHLSCARRWTKTLPSSLEYRSPLRRAILGDVCHKMAGLALEVSSITVFCWVPGMVESKGCWRGVCDCCGGWGGITTKAKKKKKKKSLPISSPVTHGLMLSFCALLLLISG